MSGKMSYRAPSLENFRHIERGESRRGEQEGRTGGENRRGEQGRRAGGENDLKLRLLIYLNEYL